MARPLASAAAAPASGATHDAAAPVAPLEGLAAPLSVFFHTNYKVHPPPADLAVTSSWYWDKHLAEAMADRARLGLTHVPLRGRRAKPLPVQFATPYQWRWIAEAAQAGQPEPFLFLDTDIVVQCSADELRRRWEAFDAPLVVGAEKSWSPSQAADRRNDPWPKTGLFRYPNSGAVMGMRSEFERVRQIQSGFPRFPCCPRLARGAWTAADGWCYQEAQHCTQAALQNGTVDAATGTFTPSVRYALDVNASLFLQLNYGGPRDHSAELADVSLRASDGKWVSRTTGTAPCILHTNGAGSTSTLLASLARRSPASAYIPNWPLLAKGYGLSAAGPGHEPESFRLPIPTAEAPSREGGATRRLHTAEAAATAPVSGAASGGAARLLSRGAIALEAALGLSLSGGAARVLPRVMPRVVQFSAPSQATTLLANAWAAALNASGGAPGSVTLAATACEAEWFNPDCHAAKRHVPVALRDAALHRALLRCFGAGGAKQQLERLSLWKECSAAEVAPLLRRFEATSLGFAKENWAALALDHFATEPGYLTYVALRPPWLTFPIARFDVWYHDLYRTFVAGRHRDGWSHADLGTLRAHLAEVHPPETTPPSVQACLAHYAHFFHLVSRAHQLGVPVLRTDVLLTAPRDELAARLAATLPAAKLGGDAAARGLAESIAGTIARDREASVNAHGEHAAAAAAAPAGAPSAASGASAVTAAIFSGHLAQWKRTGCGPPLAALSRWCAEKLGPGCAAFNSAYGIAEMPQEAPPAA